MMDEPQPYCCQDLKEFTTALERIRQAVGEADEIDPDRLDGIHSAFKHSERILEIFGMESRITTRASLHLRSRERE
jgi:hypothetical protein